MPKQIVQVTSPVKGINRVVNREGQPPDTCWDALNVLPFDPQYGRHRVAQRFGTSKAFTTQIASTATLVQGMLAVHQMVYPSVLNSTGLAIYSEPMTSIDEFKLSWQNVPSTWTVSAGKLVIPAGWTPGPTDPPLLYRNSGTIQGNLQVNFSFNYTGASASTAESLNINIGLNPSAPTQVQIDSVQTAVAYNFGGSWLFSSSLRAAGPTINSSTTTDNVFHSGSSTFPSSTTFACVGLLNGGLASATEAGLATDTNANGPPNTGKLAVTVSGSQFLYFWPDPISDPAVSLQISGLSFTNPGPFTQPIYQTLVIAVCGGFVWIGQPSPNGSIAKASGQSTALLGASGVTSMAAVNFTRSGSSTGLDPVAINSAVYIVDGTTPQVRALDLSSFTMGTLVPTSSTAPVPGSTFSMCCNWRGRLVLAGDPTQPQNFFMSRQGDPSDWDASQTDPAAAVFGNLSRSGQIGEPITALIPYTDDYMLIGCAHSLWMLEGDPADGGTIVQVSSQMGIVGKDAWCVAPTGELYFVASGGLYSVKPIWEMYQPPQLLTSENYNQFFQNTEWNFTRTSLVWDSDLHYLHMFLTPVSGSGIHLTYDARGGGLWPQQFPSAQGPTCAIQYLGDNSPTNRSILLGGYDAYIRKFDQTATDDDGSSINSHVIFGPFHPFPETGVLSACTIDLGEVAAGAVSSTTARATAVLYAGADAYEVTEGVAHSSTAIGLTLDRRQKTFRQRHRGGWFALGLFNGVDNAYFSFESATMEFEQSGRNRERR